MEAKRMSETLVNLHHSTRSYNSEDRHLGTHRLESLKAYNGVDYDAETTMLTFQF
jgi:hypothetical protein